MAWLFACFGHKKKRKRPKGAPKYATKCRKIQSYQPLESEVPKELDVKPLTCSKPDVIREDENDENKAKSRKKVKFNLQVITYYEPLPADETSSSSLDNNEDDRNWDDMGEEDDDEETSPKSCLDNAHLAKLSYSSKHRYNSYNDNEDDEYADIEGYISDLDDYDDESGGCLIDPKSIYCEEISEGSPGFFSVVPSPGSVAVPEKADNSTLNTRFRSHYIVPVLNPIENISQWKAVKARKC